METIRTFVSEYLNKHWVASDIDIMDAFIRKNYISVFKKVNYGMLAKKWESIRKYLWQFKKEDRIIEVSRVKHLCKNTKWALYSEEIFYKLK